MTWTMSGTTWHLADPAALFVLILCPFPWMKKRGRIAWPTLDGFRNIPKRKAGWQRHLPSLLLSLAIACLAFALARPQAVGGMTRIAAKGVAIVVALDRSSSMTVPDFATNAKPISRLDAAKATLSKFVQNRIDDLVGLIAFARTPLRASPATLDHAYVLEAARSIKPAKIDEDGTNLGYTIAYGLGELRQAPVEKKILILLTDGRDAPASVAGLKLIEPEDAASLASKLGITLHTIAVGSPPRTANSDESSADPGPDFERLKHLAELGGGRAFVAANAGELDRVFEAIDALEKSPVAGTVRVRYREGYAAWLAVAICLILTARLLATRTLP